MTYRRTLAAAVLTLVAVAVPSAAWFIAGTRQLERELGLRENSVYIKAQKKGLVLAERLSTRLEVLRGSESRRPFYHYQNLFHDPRGAAEGASVSISPLARGANDPLIGAHFQVDGNGRLSLPTINDEFPELGLHSTDGTHCELLEDLKAVTYFCLGEDIAAALSHEVRASPDDWGRPGRGAGNGSAKVFAEVLTKDAWRQHLRANALYADLKYAKGAKPKAVGVERGERLGVAGDGDVRITVDPFAWHTLPVGEEPGLVSLRQVDTPVGKWTQGFVISRQAIDQYLAHAYLPALFEPLLELEKESRRDRAIFPVQGTAWGVALDLSEGLGEARAAAISERDRFFLLFLLGAVGAGLAGLLVVAMVHQSERLALQRAQFAAAAAHELRTPLAGLRLYGEMLAEGLGNPDRARGYARRMAAESERLGRVVTNVLSFTRLERESISVDPRPGDLAEAVETAYERQRAALEEAGAALDLHLPDDLPAVSFDRDAVGHIVQNLLDNAEKYSRGVPDRKIEIGVEARGETALLRVADNGPGVPRDERRKLFRAFARGGHGEAEGLGLGLVLVKALADAQGARVRYRDRPGGGAEFTVAFAA